MTPETSSRVVLEVDLGKIKRNFRRIAAAVHPLDVMAVLKANAYGLGVEPLARSLKEAGATHFGVAELNEALSLRELGLPVLILGGLLAEEVPPVVEHGIIAPITDLATAEGLSAAAGARGRTAEAHVLVDTGMGRAGILAGEADALIPRIVALPHLAVNGIYSHFPFAYGDAGFSAFQVQTMLGLLARLRARGIEFATVHMANSDGINNVPASCRAPFNLVRTGINLYGVFDLQGQRTLQLEDVLRLTTRLIAVRDLPAGATIGYGQTFKLVRPMRIGLVSIGYADGLPLGMSNRGTVLIRGKHCPILGRVSMDYTTVSLDAVPEAEPGDQVVCLGDGISVADWANYKGTITYEVICSFGNRVARRYVES